ncbi:4-(cytidine 5'-diphospho)-2-C-methyl-D-erythritol kinase [Candidatus Pseudomonas adelgestsugas]|uniref:4-diphosphocytidyl-2-C-methyl-D-erythritol kinase n=1 Tax=Candidatus Pseudomonas adelgestsugas TaxID=1302376 RepID=A0ABX5R8J9_9PSED|nr:4-(cytidine 5'-diphospho)-2-C-methyl-D-erythritol kinase [Candidatus Pseudomonas adelgestsugas]QAX81751.1 4-diphosphocytidyl-2-C-methyl-D-erythritol kinase [Candidatus Pseudomonas adelgestsugas]
MPAARITLPSPAKINLMLHILGRREDGYHELQTLFQFLDYGDELTFAVRKDGIIRLHTKFKSVTHNSNLIVRAAKKIQEQSGCLLGIDIWVDKILPIGGGMGGGSSNAATTLLGLNYLWKLDWNYDCLATLGLTLGADVPVFVRGHAAFGDGVGEKLTPEYPEELWYVVLIPQVSVSTVEVFSDPLLTRNSPPIKLHHLIKVNNRNDCLPVVARRYPEVHDALNLLGKFTEAKLTGTGSCVVGGFHSKAEADKVLNCIIKTFAGFVAKGSNVSLLHRTLQHLL